MLNTRFNPNAIPQVLRDGGWHVWDGKTKRPRVPAPSAPYAKPHQHRPFLECVHFAEERGWGIGLQMASAHNVVGIDLDGCLSPDVEDWAVEIVKRANTVVYMSASCTGLRLVVGGKWPYGGKEWAHPDGRPHHGFGVYPTGTARFLTVGLPHPLCATISENQVFVDWLTETYFEPEIEARKTFSSDLQRIAEHYERCFPDTGLIPFLHESTDRWGKLWRGEWEDQYVSQSEADLALATHLCFEFVGPNPQRLETLMTVSGLGRREKWRERDDYRDWTIEKAIRGYLNSSIYVSDLVRTRK